VTREPEDQRLPGDVGAVRDLDIPHPAFDLPKPDPNDFELTAEAVPAEQPVLLFD
jgi:hypothetical protein